MPAARPHGEPRIGQPLAQRRSSRVHCQGGTVAQRLIKHLLGSHKCVYSQKIVDLLDQLFHVGHGRSAGRMGSFNIAGARANQQLGVLDPLAIDPEIECFAGQLDL